MISAISYENIHECGTAFAAQFRLRHRAFMIRQAYEVFSYNGMEYDQYDTPATIYLVYQSEKTGEALGTARLTPISQHCMIKDLWPDLIDDPACLLTPPNVWEATRFCIEKSLPVADRIRISRELVIAQIEAGLLAGIDSIIGIMPTFILNSVYKKAGCEFELLGPMKRIDGFKIKAAKMVISEDQLKRVRKETGIYKFVLKLNGGNYDIRRQAA